MKEHQCLLYFSIIMSHSVWSSTTRVGSKIKSLRLVRPKLQDHTSASTKQYLSGCSATLRVAVSATLQSTLIGSCADDDKYSLW